MPSSTATDSVKVAKPQAVAAGREVVEGLRKSAAPNKQQRVRAQILAAGLELFARKGFEATTVAEIADAAGISRRTFFRYFETKEDVVFDWLDEQGDFVHAQMAALPAGTATLLSMRDALLKLAQYLDADTARATMLTRIVFETPALSRRYQAENARWESEIAHLMQARRSPAQLFALRVQIAAGTIAFVTAMRAWAADNHGKPLRHWVAAAFRALTVGFEQFSADVTTGKTSNPGRSTP